MQTLQKKCTDECFHPFWQKVAKKAKDLDIPEAQLQSFAVPPTPFQANLQ